MKKSTLLAFAAMSMIDNGAMGIWPTRTTPPSRRKPPVQRMVTATSSEIKEWNAQVDARKAAKKGAP